MPVIMRNLVSLISAALLTSVLGSIFSTQSVISSLQSINVDVPVATRVSMTVNDFGILTALAPITATCFIIGFIVAALCYRFLGGNRLAWYTFAVAVALMATLLLIKAVVLVTPIAGARTMLGLLSFGLAGAVGGFVYAKMTSSNEASQ